MNSLTNDIHYEFNKNACEVKIPITKRGQKQNITNCDVYIYECFLVFVSDVDITKFKCPREFDLKDMKNIPINFNTSQFEYTCILPCYPEPSEEPAVAETGEINIGQFVRITDSCVLAVDGTVCKIQADFPYGFSGRYRGRPKYNEDDLSHYCKITDPSLFSPIKRQIQRENDEERDFCPDQYKLNFIELQIPEGHEDPMKYTISYEDAQLTPEDECVLEKIKSKNTPIDVEIDLTDIDCGLVSILLGICYDTRITSNEPTCGSAWTRTILSPTLSYFERFPDSRSVVESFLRRSLIYPLYRSYDLSLLCVQDALEAMLSGKSWLLKQLLVTYKCFSEADYDQKSLNKYFIKHYIWYVETMMDDDHLQMLSNNIKNVLLNTTKKNLRLGLCEIEMEILKELIDEMHLATVEEVPEEIPSGSESEVSSSESEAESESESESESETDNSNERGC